MSEIFESNIPCGSLPIKYVGAGAFVDCYYVDIAKEISLDKYIKAFYTTPLFKVERTILSIATLKSSSDREAVELSLGRSNHYSIWSVENRKPDQILLQDFTKKTRSWLMVQHTQSKENINTRLFFGSVVIPKKISESGQGSFGVLFHLFGKFHPIYSKALLSGAHKKLLIKNEAI